MSTASPFVTYSCPDWCVRWDHHADLVDADNPPVHFGPDFGLFEINAHGDGEPEVDLPATTFKGAISAAGLRKLSADALAAAEWLEVQS